MTLFAGSSLSVASSAAPGRDEHEDVDHQLQELEQRQHRHADPQPDLTAEITDEGAQLKSAESKYSQV